MKSFLVRLPEDWIEKLKKLAREEAVKKDKSVSVNSLIREALDKKYKLSGDK